MARVHFAVRASSLVVITLLGLSACERQPIPPGPGGVPRPQTRAENTEGGIQKAIFTYSRQAVAVPNGHPAAPKIVSNRLQV